MTEPHDVEGRLRAALRARAESVEPTGRFEAVERRVGAVRNRRRAATAVAASVLVAASAVGVVALAADDDDPSRVVSEPTTTAAPTTTTPSVATTTAPTTAPSVPDADAVVGWPASEWSFVSLEDAAIGFAEMVLGYANPSVVGVDGLVVEVQPGRTPSIRTRIELADAGASGGYVVVGATTDDSGHIDPLASAENGSYIVTGEAVAFEGQLHVAFLDVRGNVVAETVATAGSGPDLAPFEANLDYDPSAEPFFVLIGDGDASGEGRHSWAAVSRLQP